MQPAAVTDEMRRAVRSFVILLAGESQHAALLVCWYLRALMSPPTRPAPDSPKASRGTAARAPAGRRATCRPAAASADAARTTRCSSSSKWRSCSQPRRRPKQAPPPPTPPPPPPPPPPRPSGRCGRRRRRSRRTTACRPRPATARCARQPASSRRSAPPRPLTAAAAAACGDSTTCGRASRSLSSSLTYARACSPTRRRRAPPSSAPASAGCPRATSAARGCLWRIPSCATTR